MDSVATFGGYNTTVTGDSTHNIDAQCAQICIVKAGANYFGTVNNGTVLGDCYCGTAVTGTAALLTVCTVCNGQLTGQCGKASSGIAIYARAF